jgi:hypothetical protein
LAAFRDGTPTRDEIKQLSTSLMNWYFDKGGLYLSKETRDACVALQRALRVINQADRDQIVDVDTFDHLRELASELRSMMTYDVGTRKPFSMRERSDGTRDWQPLDTKSVPRNAHSSERWIVDNW